MDLPLRDPDLLELLQRLREGTLAHARRHAQLVEALRPGKQTVEDRELELGADHLEGDHRPAPGALAGAFLLGHDFASLHYTRGVRGISSFFSVPRFGLKPSPAWKRHARTYTSTWRYEELSSHRAPQAGGRGPGDESRPPGDDHLAVREESDRIAALGVKVAEERVLHSAEREVGHRGRDADVDSDVPGAHAGPEVPGVLAARRVDRRRIPIRAAVDRLDRLLEALRLKQARDRPEDFLPGDAHFGPDGVEDRRADEIAIVAGDADLPPRPHDLGAFLLTPFNEAHDPVAMGRRDHRAHLDRLVQAVSDLQRGRGVRELAAEIRVDFPDANDYGAREASFAGAAVAGRDQVRYDFVELRVRHDHEDVLRSAAGLNALPLRGGSAVHEPGHRTRADERDPANLRMIEERVHGILRSMDEAHDAGGKSGPLDQLHHELHRRWILLRSIRDPAVPRRDGVRPEPELHHHGEVERADSREHAERFVRDLLVDPGSRAVGEVVPHHETWNARRGFDVLDRAADLAPRLLDRLAHVLDDDP